MSLDPTTLRLVQYPDPRLRRKGAAVTRFDSDVAAVARRMLDLMRAHRGVGLAAPQVGLPIRLFVMNETDDPARDLVFVNPVVTQREGVAEAVEGCLSLPGVDVTVRRAASCRIAACDLSGRPFEMEARELVARIWQHETDHLDGVLIIDKMGPTDEIANRKTLAALETDYHASHPGPARTGAGRRKRVRR